MAKRFTDTDKWKSSWFRGLHPHAKLAWIYITDQCDHTGIWKSDFELMSFMLGLNISEEDFTGWLAGKVHKFDTDKFFIRSFFEFQYADSKDSFKAKQSAQAKLEKLGLLNSFVTVPNTTEVSMDSPSIGIGNTSSLHAVETEKFDLESAYRRYPRKEGKTPGLKRLKPQIKTQADFDALIKAVENYAASRRGEDPKFTKMFSTFVSEWRDWIEYTPRITSTINLIPKSL